MICTSQGWIAAPPAGRLIVVNEQISFECTYGATSVPGETPEISTMTLERMTSQAGSTIKPDALRDFPLFADFNDRELRRHQRACSTRLALTVPTALPASITAESTCTP